MKSLIVLMITTFIGNFAYAQIDCKFKSATEDMNLQATGGAIKSVSIQDPRDAESKYVAPAKFTIEFGKEEFIKFESFTLAADSKNFDAWNSEAINYNGETYQVKAFRKRRGHNNESIGYNYLFDMNFYNIKNPFQFIKIACLVPIVIF
jgi:hypothetical protein